MVRTIAAIYDGQVLRLEEPLDFVANTRVLVTIRSEDEAPVQSASFLDTARKLNLEGPSDWSERFEDYLYGSGHDA